MRQRGARAARIGIPMTWLVADERARRVLTGLGWTDAASALADPRGRTVRCTPRRRTTLQVCSDGARIFKKHRRGGVAAARREWQWLQELGRRGFATVAPLCFAARGADSLLVTHAAHGCAGDVWLAREPGACELAALEFAPVVARLHAAGLCYRDLYWNHVIREDGRFLVLDVERVFAPRLFFARWRRKDLAGLVASLPRGVATRTQLLRFLLHYAGGVLPADWKALVRGVLAKAERIRGHRPKYG